MVEEIKAQIRAYCDLRFTEEELNYLENVDKTFVYANPNKRHISIQEFERMEFEQLQGEE